MTPMNDILPYPKSPQKSVHLRLFATAARA